MQTAAALLTGFVALLHLWFMVLEMFLWTKPLGRRVFKLTEEKAQATKTLAANQGLYTTGFSPRGSRGGCGSVRKAVLFACSSLAA